MQEVWFTVSRILKVDHSKIDGVQQRSIRRWDVTLFPQYQSTFDRLKFDFMDSELRICNDKIVRIIDPLETVTEVTVRKVPMYWSNMRIVKIFEGYGVIKNIRKERYSNEDAEGTPFVGLWNGNLHIKMVLRTKIPSGITISGETIEIFHRDQDHTCRTCGLPGHKFFECRTPKAERLNVFSLEDFPPGVTRQQQQ